MGGRGECEIKRAIHLVVRLVDIHSLLLVFYYVTCSPTSLQVKGSHISKIMWGKHDMLVGKVRELIIWQLCGHVIRDMKAEWPL